MIVSEILKQVDVCARRQAQNIQWLTVLCHHDCHRRDFPVPGKYQVPQVALAGILADIDANAVAVVRAEHRVGVCISAK